MKSIKLLPPCIAKLKMVLLEISLFYNTGIYAQFDQSVTGKVIDEKTNQAVPFASVALFKDSGSKPVRGTTGDSEGAFTIGQVPVGKYTLLVTFIGYKQASRMIDIADKEKTDAGTIFLRDTAVMIKEAMIMGEKVRAKSQSDKTIFFMTKKLLDASSTGMDVLKVIPGIQVDLMQNISLEGSRNIQIFVDGKERDKGFISQLNPGQIEKVEIMNKPSSNYDGNSTGAINIILKKERDSGINGHIYGEIPASVSEIYLRPTFTMNYGFKKLNLYSSYKGELTYFDIHESTIRKVRKSTGTDIISSNQYVRQKDWSHRFNYGFDYFLNAHNQLNFYAFYNPYSRELDGYADSQISGSIDKNWKAKKEDTDINTGQLYSVYYKHDFNKEGRALIIEISNYNLKAKNSTAYISEETEIVSTLQVNTIKPVQNETSIKLDYTTVIANKLNFSTGLKTRYQALQDRHLPDFHYHEKLMAAYGTLAYKKGKYDLNLGLRAENSVSILKNNFRNPYFSLFPKATLHYKPSSRQSIQLSYLRSIRRPRIYELNPFISIHDPYSLSSGNPFLKPELHSSIFLDHSIQFNSNYFSSRLFYSKMNNVINSLTSINDTGSIETRVHNLGSIHQFGVQFSGTLKLGIATINPYLRLFDLYSSGNDLAKQNDVENRHSLSFNSGLSAILSFKHELTLSFVFQYGTPENDIQGNSFCDALYFISLEKSFKQKIKIGLVSAIPFARSFTYQGSEIDGSGFYSRYDGNIKLSNPMCWFKLSYQFTSGKNRNKINHEIEEIDNKPNKGF